MHERVAMVRRRVREAEQSALTADCQSGRKNDGREKKRTAMTAGMAMRRGCPTALTSCVAVEGTSAAVSTSARREREEKVATDVLTPVPRRNLLPCTVLVVLLGVLVTLRRLGVLLVALRARGEGSSSAGELREGGDLLRCY